MLKYIIIIYRNIKLARYVLFRKKIIYIILHTIAREKNTII